MDRVKRIFKLIHLLVWVLFALLVGVQLNAEGDAYWFRNSLVLIITCLYSFYFQFFLLQQKAGKKKNSNYILKLAVIAITAPLINFVYEKPPFNHYLVHLVLTVPVFLFLGWLAWITERLVINSFKKEQLEKQAVEAELYALKSQINPHFLFNTLNNIHTLVYKQAPAAPEAVMRLASLMRYMIYESNASSVPLTSEINYLHDYISLQQLRYKQSAIVDFTIEGAVESTYIAPLLFIHLLENAYQHSPSQLQPGDIQMRLAVQDHSLVFSIVNPISKSPENNLAAPGGVGVANVKKRLALLYPNQYQLDIVNNNNQFAVNLEIRNPHLLPNEREANLFYH